MSDWIYYEVLEPDTGELRTGYRYDGHGYAEKMHPGTTWEESDHFVHMLIRGENKLHRLDGIPAWAYDSQGNLIP